ncbi:pyruvate, phosphate dikinase [Candidatus Micrarchaeota archaeon]|nr:pyruvate, phosphate dikinase [Candidatus Micrarchaeota archaeon]
MTEKYVYFFGEGKTEMKQLLGGKGANLSEMINIGVPVPPGFTITTQTCKEFYENNKTYSDEVKKQVEENLKKLEEKIGKKFGDASNPLLVSVRSGAAVSMPGMMDTVLNLGLNDETVEGLAKKTGNERFALDSYRRFLQMFGDVVLGVRHSLFEKNLQAVKDERGVIFDTDLSVGDLKKIVVRFKQLIKNETGSDFPSDPKTQLWKSIDAVFGSWNNDRAISYRRLNEIKGLIGTAVNIQVMVFGNMGETSGTGVAFTRNPANGENRLYGEYLMNAQGEDVVAGIRTPLPISELEKENPEIYKQFSETMKKLETHYKDMQDIEFTIQEGVLYFLQTRNGKRTTAAAVKIVVDMVKEGLTDKETALMRIEPNQLDQLLHKQLDPIAKNNSKVIARGLPASPGAAVGNAVFSALEAQKSASDGNRAILIRKETSPEDIEGMDAASGILTSTGGMTSHAAVVARGMGKCCIAGCGDINVDEENKQFTTKQGVLIKEGDYITLDGTTGEVIKGEVRVIDPELGEDFETLMTWADEIRKLKVRTNADNPKDSDIARKFGAEGIGLCRTEHMFFDEERIKTVREMILSGNKEGREKALQKIRPMQEGDFYGIFKAMEGYPVTIRLLDPPLHEFLPKEDNDIQELANEMETTTSQLKEVIQDLHEFNPMLGHRGCRLAITYPEIAVMQTQAIIGAALKAQKQGIKVIPEIMIPLVGKVEELVFLEDIIRKTADEIIKESAQSLQYKVGTMIEIPRAALTADQIAEHAEFFSFGTNDLTQMTFGYSRDDAGKFINEYKKVGILEKDPFQTIDQTGVGKLIKMACELGRKKRPNIKLGICGEHGGDPDSIEFCNMVGLSYVSCSPYRVPIARLAAAQAVLKNK